MLRIERNQHCIIVYNEKEGRGIAFPSEKDKDIKLYITELQECTRKLMTGVILVTILFDPKYEENHRPMQLFLKTHDTESLLHEDNTAKELYEFFFAHAIPQITPTSVSYIFCK